jgi:hypothetical protein
MTTSAGAEATTITTYTNSSTTRRGIMPDGNSGLIGTADGVIPSIPGSTGTLTKLEAGILNMDGTHHALDASHIDYSTVSSMR